MQSKELTHPSNKEQVLKDSFFLKDRVLESRPKTYKFGETWTLHCSTLSNPPSNYLPFTYPTFPYHYSKIFEANFIFLYPNYSEGVQYPSFLWNHNPTRSSFENNSIVSSLSKIYYHSIGHPNINIYLNPDSNNQEALISQLICSNPDNKNKSQTLSSDFLQRNIITIQNKNQTNDNSISIKKKNRKFFHFLSLPFENPSQVKTYKNNFSWIKIQDLIKNTFQCGIHVIDCDYSGSFYQIYEELLKKLNDYGWNTDLIAFFSCQSNQRVPIVKGLPIDLFTSCLLTPGKIAILWHSIRLHSFSHSFQKKVSLKTIDSINPQTIDAIEQVLLELVEAMYSNISNRLFWTLFREDKAIAKITSGFALACRIFESFGITPLSIPQLPSLKNDTLWSHLDFFIDTILVSSQANFSSNTFSSFQLSLQSIFEDDFNLNSFTELIPYLSSLPQMLTNKETMNQTITSTFDLINYITSDFNPVFTPDTYQTFCLNYEKKHEKKQKISRLLTKFPVINSFVEIIVSDLLDQDETSSIFIPFITSIHDCSTSPSKLETKLSLQDFEKSMICIAKLFSIDPYIYLSLPPNFFSILIFTLNKRCFKYLLSNSEGSEIIEH